MTTPALLVSHGQPSDPDVAEAEIAALADQVRACLPEGWDLRTATLAAPGALEAALKGTEAPLIYPMFMSEGWFTRSVLRRRLAGRAAVVLPPFGLDPGLPALAEDLLRAVLADQGWRAEDTQLFLPGHGSGRSANAARDTHVFADALARRIRFAEQRVGFVEEPPRLAPVAKGLGAQSICLPFFAARRGHVLTDIPEALAATGFAGVALDPIGCAAQVPALIANALIKAQDQAAPKSDKRPRALRNSVENP